MRKKGIGMDKQLDEGAGELPEGFKVNYLYAVIPLLPLIILMLGNTGALPMLKMPVSHAMIIGAVVAMLATRPTREIFRKPSLRAWVIRSVPFSASSLLPISLWPV